GHQAISLTGSQSGIITNSRHSGARIIDVRPFRVQDELEDGKIVIVAGFQGVSYKREVTTLGRGGTDTTAVAMAAALGAEHCEICSDVDGVYTADPRLVPEARRLAELTPEEMIALARTGSKVLNQDCVEYAARAGIAIFAKSTLGPRDDSGTVVRTNPSRELRPVSALSHRKAIAEVELTSADDLPQALEAMTAHGVFPAALEGGGAGRA